MCIFFHRDRRSLRGSKGQIRFFNRRKKIIISNDKNNSVNVFHMDRETKVSTVTPSSDLSLRGQRSKKVKISNCSNCVEIAQEYSLHNPKYVKNMFDPIRDPGVILRGQRSKKQNNSNCSNCVKIAQEYSSHHS